MDVSVSQTQTTVVTTRSIERLDAGHGLHAVRWTDTTATTVARNGVERVESQSVVHERILSDAQRQEVEDGLSPSRAPHYVLLAPSALEALRVHTYYAFVHVLHDGNLDKDEPTFVGPLTQHQVLAYQHAHHVANTPFTALLNGAAVGCIVGENKTDSHSVVGMDGRDFARMQVGEYTSGHFDNGHYDLEKAATHLLTRPDVRLYADTGYRRNRSNLVATPQEAIHNIPGYNSEPGRSQHLLFRWMPSQEDWDKLCAAKKGHKRGLMSDDVWRTVFELDLLGLRACGAALFTDYYECRSIGGGDDDD
jgi:hypothetical protein